MRMMDKLSNAVAVGKLQVVLKISPDFFLHHLISENSLALWLTETVTAADQPIMIRPHESYFSPFFGSPDALF